MDDVPGTYRQALDENVPQWSTDASILLNFIMSMVLPQHQHAYSMAGEYDFAMMYGYTTLRKIHARDPTLIVNEAAQFLAEALSENRLPAPPVNSDTWSDILLITLRMYVTTLALQEISKYLKVDSGYIWNLRGRILLETMDALWRYLHNTLVGNTRGQKSLRAELAHASLAALFLGMQL